MKRTPNPSRLRFVARQRNNRWCVIDTWQPAEPKEICVHKFEAGNKALELNREWQAERQRLSALEQGTRWHQAMERNLNPIRR